MFNDATRAPDAGASCAIGQISTLTHDLAFGGRARRRWRLFRHDAARVVSFPAGAYVALFAVAQWIDLQSAATHGSAGYWLSGGVMVAALLQLHRRPATVVLIACFIISFLGEAIRGGSALFSGLVTVSNHGSAMLAVILARRFSGAALDLCRPGRLVGFGVRAAIPASFLSAALHFGVASAAIDMGTSVALLDASYQFIAHLLSLLLVTPILLMLLRRQRFELVKHLLNPKAIGQLALLAAVTALVFTQTAMPLLFLVFPPLVYLALRQPPTVVGVAMVLLASISGAATANGQGPVHTLPVMPFVGLEALSLTLQRLGLYNLFLLSIIISILPISSVMSERRRIASKLEERTLLARRSALNARAAFCALNTERRENAAKESFYQKLVELMPSFLIVKNAGDGTFVLINPAATEALGLDPEDCIGKTVVDLFPGEEAAASAAEDQLVIKNRKVAIEVAAPITMANGELKYYTTRKVAIFEGDTPTYIVTAGQDVTEQTQTQSALEQAVEAAERANSAKSQFLANMSHELRTPLNGIIAMADMLLEAQADDRSRQMVGTIVESGRMLEYVVNDILDVAKIEAGQMKLESEPFDLDSVVAGISSLHKAAAVGKGIALDLVIDPAASGIYQGDRTRVGQIISNLLSNAVKFTAQGVVKVSVRKGRHGVRVRVSDTGPGFDRLTARRLFDRFEQADVSMSRRHGGTGLGLSICKSFSEMMGGKISVRSVPGKGTLFAVTLPLVWLREREDAHDGPEPAAADDQAEAANMRILFADDHEVNRRVVAMILEPLGVDLTVVENGQEAVDAAANAAFDLILMDVQMPVMDGLTATRQIRKMEGDRGLDRTPIISLTANAMPDDVRRSLDAGSDLHMPKPIRPADLIKALSDLMTTTGQKTETVEAA